MCLFFFGWRWIETLQISLRGCSYLSSVLFICDIPPLKKKQMQYKSCVNYFSSVISNAKKVNPPLRRESKAKLSRHQMQLCKISVIIKTQSLSILLMTSLLLQNSVLKSRNTSFFWLLNGIRSLNS